MGLTLPLSSTSYHSIMTGLEPKLFVFLLSTFLGLEVIRRVSPLLHTPLMSLTNAISAISLIGSLVILGEQRNMLTTVLGAIADAQGIQNAMRFQAVIGAATFVLAWLLPTERRIRELTSRD